MDPRGTTPLQLIHVLTRVPDGVRIVDSGSGYVSLVRGSRFVGYIELSPEPVLHLYVSGEMDRVYSQSDGWRDDR